VICFLYNNIYKLIMNLGIYITEIRDGEVRRKKELYTWKQLEEELKYIGDFGNNSLAVVDLLNGYSIIRNFKTVKSDISKIKIAFSKLLEDKQYLKIYEENEPYKINAKIMLKKEKEFDYNE